MLAHQFKTYVESLRDSGRNAWNISAYVKYGVVACSEDMLLFVDGSTFGDEIGCYSRISVGDVSDVLRWTFFEGIHCALDETPVNDATVFVLKIVDLESLGDALSLDVKVLEAIRRDVERNGL